MTTPELTRAIQAALPELIAADPAVRDFVLQTVSNYYAGKEATESRFDQVLAELQRDREEQSRQWEEQRRDNQAMLARMQQDREEQSRKWEEQRRDNQVMLAQMQQDREEQSRQWREQREEQSRRWGESDRRWHEQHQENMSVLARMQQDREEQSRQWEEQREEQSRRWGESDRRWHEQHQENMSMLAQMQDQKRRYDSTIGALGARWGLYSEASFRNALKGILEESFGVQVLNVNDFDDAGEVFGRPEQVELDLIIKNGTVIVCEIKSSISKSEMYIFDRKVAFYQKRHERPVSRKLVISPMVDSRALPVAAALGIEVYSYADAVENL
jgi:hypothetical protein